MCAKEPLVVQGLQMARFSDPPRAATHEFSGELMYVKVWLPVNVVIRMFFILVDAACHDFQESNSSDF